MNKQVFSTGFLFPLTHVIAGVIFFLGGITLIVFNEGNPLAFLLGLPLFIGGSIWCMCFKGGMIDIENKKVMPFLSFLGIKLGFWKPIDNYSYVCMLQHLNREDLDAPVAPANVSPNSVFDFSRYFYTYEICFLSTDHLQKLPFVASEKKEIIQPILMAISEKLNLPIVTYNPKLNRHR